MTNVFMFSGQGAQYFQMGRVLFEKNHVFRDSMLDLDGVARRLLGESIVGALYETSKGISEIFDQIRLTHPAIFMVEYAMARALISAGVMPGCLLGVSLGTFAASVVAGCLEPESALEMVIEHASAIEAECPRGIMIAVLAPLSLAQGRGGQLGRAFCHLGSAGSLPADRTRSTRTPCHVRSFACSLCVPFALDRACKSTARGVKLTSVLQTGLTADCLLPACGVAT